MPLTSRQSELARQSSFVFKGTVKKLKTATMPSVPVTNQTAVVHVDQIQQAPKILSSYEGRDITVQLNQASKLKTGQQAIFYTNEWLFGDSVAVQEKAHTEVGKHAAVLKSNSTSSTKDDQALKAHLGDADVVVRGRVVSVGLPPESAIIRGRTAVGTAAPTGRVSEHSARWHEAIIDVQSVEKGHESHKQIVVQFPGSSDVAWAKAPKFEPGQEGLFVLHKNLSGEAPSPRGAKAKKKRPLQTYVALHANDFLPTPRAEDLKALMPAAARKRSNKKR